MDGVGIRTFPIGTPAGDYLLVSPVVSALVWHTDKWVCTDNKANEYGLGDTQEEATADLLSSLSDLRHWLEKHEATLPEKHREELAYLQEVMA